MILLHSPSLLLFPLPFALFPSLAASIFSTALGSLGLSPMASAIDIAVLPPDPALALALSARLPMSASTLASGVPLAASVQPERPRTTTQLLPGPAGEQPRRRRRAASSSSSSLPTPGSGEFSIHVCGLPGDIVYNF